MIAVMCSVHREEPGQVAVAMESLGRVAAGLALEGRTVNVTIVTVEDDDS